ncbi:MAG: hypothetical protein M3Y17_10075 [Actinomycetota bacterium]|nr:hypothetical protein [Actinomycetota bacterium]
MSTAALGLGLTGTAAAAQGPYCGSRSNRRAFPPTCVHTPAHKTYTSLQGRFNSKNSSAFVGLTHNMYAHNFNSFYSYGFASGSYINDRVVPHQSYAFAGIGDPGFSVIGNGYLITRQGG